eukprot:g2224.t1
MGNVLARCFEVDPTPVDSNVGFDESQRSNHCCQDDGNDACCKLESLQAHVHNDEITKSSCCDTDGNCHANANHSHGHGHGTTGQRSSIVDFMSQFSGGKEVKVKKTRLSLAEKMDAATKKGPNKVNKSTDITECSDANDDPNNGCCNNHVEQSSFGPTASEKKKYAQHFRNHLKQGFSALKINNGNGKMVKRHFHAVEEHFGCNKGKSVLTLGWNTKKKRKQCESSLTPTRLLRSARGGEMHYTLPLTEGSIRNVIRKGNDEKSHNVVLQCAQRNLEFSFDSAQDADYYYKGFSLLAETSVADISDESCCN